MDRLSVLLRTFAPKALQVSYRALSAGTTPLEPLTDHSRIWLLQTGRLQITGATEQPLTVRDGDLLWWPTATAFQVRSLTAAPVTVVESQLDFGPVTLNPLFDTLPILITITAEQDRQRELAPLIELMAREAEQQRCGHSAVINRLAEVLLVQILRFVMKHTTLDYGVLAGLGNLRLARALTAIHDQPEVNWTVATLAERAGMSRTAFNLAFGRVIGYPPGEYLTRWRMRMAVCWLTRSQMPIAVIGERLGYDSETAFRRAFRKTVGQPPGQLRREHADDPVVGTMMPIARRHGDQPAAAGT